MNIQSIVVTNLIGIALMIILAVNSRFTRQEKSTGNTLLNVMCFIVGFSCFSEMASFLVDGKLFSGALALGYLFNTCLYLCNTLFCVIWVCYIDWKLYADSTRFRRHYRPLFATAGILILLVFGNLFGHYLFYFDSYNIYHRTPMCYILLLFPLIMIAYTIFMVYRFRKERHGLDFFPIWSFTLPFFIGVIAQALFYGLSLAWCSTAIGLVSLCLALQNELISTDSLTGLYNRFFLRQILNGSRWNSSSHRSGIMIDMDYFKEINDTYGHSQGDNALCDMADILEKAAPKDALLFRYAGDEFIILLMTDDEEKIRSVMRAVRQETDQFNDTADRRYVLQLSMGYAVYDRKNIGQDAFFEKMDRFMYLNKAERRQNQDTIRISRIRS